ncbi:hypothetical protein Q2K19_30665 [Micromonospora soli]|nr:hypothetical protein [Micromonospora sp. NBRC 110009]WKT98466.1 hypothetical protein Q2K19_30665 [Micromonospora sp. NBRC 110009]
MATLLYRLGRVSMRWRRLVVALWVVIIVGLGLAAATLRGPTASHLTTPGTESQRAQLDGRYSRIEVQFAKDLGEVTADQRTAFEKFGAAAVIRSDRGFASAEAIGAAVAAIVLVVTFESLVVAGMTILLTSLFSGFLLAEVNGTLRRLAALQPTAIESASASSADADGIAAFSLRSKPHRGPRGTPFLMMVRSLGLGHATCQ